MGGRGEGEKEMKANWRGEEKYSMNKRSSRPVGKETEWST